MSVWKVVWRVVDTVLGIAIRADELNDRRKAKKRLRDLVEARAKDAAAERAKAPTVILRRRPPP